MSDPSAQSVAEAVVRLRRQVSDLHRELVRHGLVVWTAGNVSARVPGADLFVIKPSGVDDDALSPDDMVVCDLDGDRAEAYASAWAARGEAVPCVLTAMADEFGAEIPVGPFALIGDDSIGKGIVETLTGHRSPAVLMRGHGVFTIGKDARAAVKAAVMCEDAARTAHISRQLGEPLPIGRSDIDRLYDRYQNVYGQPRTSSERGATA